MLDFLCSEIKERIKKTKDEKKAKKAEVMAKAQKSSKGSLPKGAAPKGPKLGGGGGKRWNPFFLCSTINSLLKEFCIGDFTWIKVDCCHFVH